jgi:arginyl-tRNA synthetase
MTTQLADAISAAVAAELSGRGLPAGTPVPAVTLARPRDPGHGDYAATIALQLAPALGASPRELASTLAGRLAGPPRWPRCTWRGRDSSTSG